LVLVQVLLETLGFEQPVEDGALAPGGEKGLVVDGFHALLEPRLLARVLDVHEFDADVAAIGLMQDRHDLSDRRRFQPQHVVDVDNPVHIPILEAIGGGVELGMVLAFFQLQGVELSQQMAAHPVGPDQHQGADRIQRRLADPAGAHARHRLGGRFGRLFAGCLSRQQGQIVAAGDVGVRRCPRSALLFLHEVAGFVGEAGKERLPIGIDRTRIVQKAFVHLGDVNLIAGIKEFVGVEFCHGVSARPGGASSLVQSVWGAFKR